MSGARRLLVIFALLGVVGTAGAFAGGALPGPAGVSFGAISTYFCALVGSGCSFTGTGSVSLTTTAGTSVASSNYKSINNSGTIMSIGLGATADGNFPSTNYWTATGAGAFFVGPTGAGTGVNAPVFVVWDNAFATGVHLVVNGGGLVSLGHSPQLLTCADSGGAGAGAVNVDPQSSTVIITNNDTLGGCVATMQETTVATANATVGPNLGSRVTICSSPQSQATLLTFADVANVFRGGATQATGLLAGDCFDMVYIDDTNDLWLATGPVSIN